MRVSLSLTCLPLPPAAGMTACLNPSLALETHKDRPAALFDRLISQG
jgi:hypothetical protein